MNVRDFALVAIAAGMLTPTMVDAEETAEYWVKNVGTASSYLFAPGLAQHTRMEGVNIRGDMAMGFDHSKTTHHFKLFKDGGAIGVDANDSHDTETREAIRKHLRMIAGMFAAGNFELPMFIHATTPPGMKTMKRLTKNIAYRYEDTPKGAQVHLATHNRKARVAIHKFLRFQIRDHRTGDRLTVQNEQPLQ